MELYFLLVFEDGEGVGVYEFSSLAEAEETAKYWETRMFPNAKYVPITVTA